MCALSEKRRETELRCCKAVKASVIVSLPNIRVAHTQAAVQIYPISNSTKLTEKGSFLYIELLVVLEDIQLITLCVILYSTLVLETFSV